MGLGRGGTAAAGGVGGGVGGVVAAFGTTEGTGGSAAGPAAGGRAPFSQSGSSSLKACGSCAGGFIVFGPAEVRSLATSGGAIDFNQSGISAAARGSAEGGVLISAGG